MKELDLKETFSFGDDKAKQFIVREMGLLKKFKNSFNYLTTRLKPQKVKKDLSKLKWDEGKNYNWAYLKDKDVELILRQYGNHFTVYCKNTKLEKYEFKDITYSCFTFSTDTNLLSDKDKDKRYDNFFFDMNNHILKLIEVVRENGVHWLWNNVSYVREDFIVLKQVFDGESLYSLDLFLFSCDELFSKHFEIFAINETLTRLNDFKEGEIFNSDFHGEVTISKIETKVKNDYFHNVGLELTNSKGEKNFRDVYYLTRWEYDSMFKNKSK